MSPAGFRYSLSRSRAERYVAADAHAATHRAAQRVALRSRASVLGQGRINTSEMIRSFRVIDITTNPLRPRHRVSNRTPQATYQELGTRAHGPVRAKALRFKPKGSSVFVFAKWVRGVTPGNFMKTAIENTVITDFTGAPAGEV